MPLLLCVGARCQERGSRVMNRDERQHEPRRVVRGQLLIEHDLPAGRHAAAPFARPVRHGESRGAQLLEPVLLKGDEGFVGRAGLTAPPIGGYVVATPLPDLGAKVLEVGQEVQRSDLKVFTWPSSRRRRRWSGP